MPLEPMQVTDGAGRYGRSPGVMAGNIRSQCVFWDIKGPQGCKFCIVLVGLSLKEMEFLNLGLRYDSSK